MNLYEGYIIITGDYLTEDILTLEVVERVRKTSKDLNEFKAFLRDLGEKLKDDIMDFIIFFVNVNFAGRVDLRDDYKDIKLIGEVETEIEGKKLEDVTLLLKGYDYSMDLWDYLENKGW